VGAALFIWLGRCSSLTVFACGGSEVVPPLQPLPPSLQHVLEAIFFFVVAMILWAIADIIGTLLRDLDVLAQRSHDPKAVYRFAHYIFKIFGLATREINHIGNATLQSPTTSKRSSKRSKAGVSTT
jgi:hypothetical protein